MKNLLFILSFLLFCSAVSAQRNFELKDASKYFDIKISAEDCNENECIGKAAFSFFKKGGTTPYQVIEHDETVIILDWSSEKIGEKLTYKKQSTIEVGDFNFDGMEDVAICNGRYGNYGAQSFDIYLSSKSAGKFVHNEAFSELGQNYMGLFGVDKKKKILNVFAKSGCCWHVKEEYKVVNNRPVKVFVEEEDATIPNESKVKITTKRLVNGKWQTKVKYVKREQ